MMRTDHTARLTEVLRVLEATANAVREILGEELDAIPDSPDGWAGTQDVADLLGVSGTPARNWMIRNGAIQRNFHGGTKGKWEMPWSAVVRLANDPTIRKPQRRPNSEGLVKNPKGSPAPVVHHFHALPLTIIEKVKHSDEGCWDWQAGMGADNRPRLQWGGKARLADRVIYELMTGKDIEGLWIRNTCDNDFCVRPDHMHTLEPERPKRKKERNE